MDEQNPQVLRIECQGATTVTLDELHDLQGNLKDLTEQNYVKLRNSMTKYGFSFPIFFWTDTEGNKWILDAHQRTRTLRKMQQEGYTIPSLPADPIFADSKKQAKEKLLLLNSRYGKIDIAGYEEFINEVGAEIFDDDELHDMLVIPEISLFAGAEIAEEKEQATSDNTNPEKVREITCPACSHKFTLFGNEN